MQIYRKVMETLARVTGADNLTERESIPEHERYIERIHKRKL